MEEMTEPVEIWKFSKPIEARMAAEALEARGIPTILAGGNLGNTFIGLELSWKPGASLISLSVPQEKSKEALFILRGMFGQPEKEDNASGNG